MTNKQLFGRLGRTIAKAFAGRQSRVKWISPRRGHFELLEDRRMLAIDVEGHITSNTSWSVPGETYRMVGIVTVDPAVTLTIAPGVTVLSWNSTYDLDVEGTLNATGVVFSTSTDVDVKEGGKAYLSNCTFGGEAVRYRGGSGGSVTGSQFDSSVLELYATAVSVNDNTFTLSEPIIVTSTLVPELFNNTFTSAATLRVEGNVTSDTTWKCLDNVSRYKQHSLSVLIEPGVVLDIESGVTVLSWNSTYDLDVEGTLNATGVVFSTSTDVDVKEGGKAYLSNCTFGGEAVRYRGGSGGSVTGSQFDSSVLELYATAVSVNDNTFTLSEPIIVTSTLVPELFNNTFTSAATLRVEGNVTSDTTWKCLDNVSRYKQHSLSVLIEPGVVLDIESGVTVLSWNSTYDLDVEGTLNATGVVFSTSTDVDVKEGGKAYLSNCTFGGEAVRYRGGSGGSVTGSQFDSSVLELYATAVSVNDNTFTLSEPIIVTSTLVPELFNNTFTSAATLRVEGNVTSDTTWKCLDNVSRYKQHSLSVLIEPGVVLDIESGVTVLSWNSTYDLDVEGTLNATGVVFSTSTDVDVKEGGKAYLSNCTFGGEAVRYRGGSGGNMQNCEVEGATLHINSESGANVYYNNSFETGTVEAEGDNSVTIDLRNNYWGNPITEQEIEDKILHQHDDDDRPLVLYSPWLTQWPVVTTEPEIEVAGNGVSIVNGDTQPSTADGTNFGVVAKGSTPPSRSFVVHNDGDATLTLGSPSVPTGFALTEPLDSSLAAGGYDSFTVQMDTGSLGTKEGLVTLATNDSDENPFTFTIEGIVIPPWVTVSATIASASEPTDDGMYRIERTGSTLSTLTVDFAMSGDATQDVDYVLKVDDATLTNSVTIPAGQTYVDVTVAVTDDSDIEPAESATFSILAGSGYLVGSPFDATVSIADNDTDDLWRFDFGTMASDIESGYVSVNGETLYGVGGNVFGWDRSVGHYDSIGDPLTGDFNFSDTADFKVDVASGRYEVVLYVGNPLPFRHDQMGIFLEGGQADAIDTAPGQVVARTYYVTVDDGTLNVGLQDLGGGDPNVVIEALELRETPVVDEWQFDFGTSTSPVDGRLDRAFQSQPLLSFGRLRVGSTCRNTQFLRLRQRRAER